MKNILEKRATNFVIFMKLSLYFYTGSVICAVKSLFPNYFENVPKNINDLIKSELSNFQS